MAKGKKKEVVVDDSATRKALNELLIKIGKK